MKFFELVTTKAYAQFGGSGGNTTNRFELDDFLFLKPFSTDNPASTIDSVFASVVSLVLTVAAIVAFFYLIVSGFQYITAGGDAAKAQTARQGIVNALIGVVIILVSYLVLRYVVVGFSTGRG